MGTRCSVLTALLPPRRAVGDRAADMTARVRDASPSWYPGERNHHSCPLLSVGRRDLCSWFERDAGPMRLNWLKPSSSPPHVASCVSTSSDMTPSPVPLVGLQHVWCLQPGNDHIDRQGPLHPTEVTLIPSAWWPPLGRASSWDHSRLEAELQCRQGFCQHLLAELLSLKWK